MLAVPQPAGKKEAGFGCWMQKGTNTPKEVRTRGRIRKWAEETLERKSGIHQEQYVRTFRSYCLGWGVRMLASFLNSAEGKVPKCFERIRDKVVCGQNTEQITR